MVVIFILAVFNYGKPMDFDQIHSETVETGLELSAETGTKVKRMRCSGVTNTSRVILLLA